MTANEPCRSLVVNDVTVHQPATSVIILRYVAATLVCQTVLVGTKTSLNNSITVLVKQQNAFKSYYTTHVMHKITEITRLSSEIQELIEHKTDTRHASSGHILTISVYLHQICRSKLSHQLTGN